MTFSPKCFNSFRTRWKDDVRATLLQGPGETARPFLGTSPDSVPTVESISARQFPPRGKGKDRRHLRGDVRATQLVGGGAQAVTQVWMAAQPSPLPQLRSSELAVYALLWLGPLPLHLRSLSPSSSVLAETPGGVVCVLSQRHGSPPCIRRVHSDGQAWLSASTTKLTPGWHRTAHTS